MLFRVAFPIAFLLLPIFFLRLPGKLPAYSNTDAIIGAGATWRIRLRLLPGVLRRLAVLLLILALAAPQIGQSEPGAVIEGIDIVLAIDISSSMGTEDTPSQTRLEVAKDVIAEFIGKRPSDRIGIVIFSRQSFQVVPPTLDHSTLLASLHDIPLVTEMDSEDGTAIGLGLASAANMLRTTNGKSKIIILLTDGLNTAGTISPLTAARALSALGLRVYTIGIGETSSEDNNTETASLDENTLRAVASVTDGRYFRALDRGELEQIYVEIDTLERLPFSVPQAVVWSDLLDIWLASALVALLLEQLLRYTVFRRVL